MIKQCILVSVPVQLKRYTIPANVQNTQYCSVLVVMTNLYLSLSLSLSLSLVCYYNSLSEKRGNFTVSNTDPNKCTHVIYAFSDIKKQHRLVPSTATEILRYQAFNGLKTRYLDFINVLTFDFHGPWESVTGHHSPLYQGSQDTGNKTYFNTDYAINMGLVAYGRVFNLSSASSVVGAPASGASIGGLFTGEEGLWAYYEADQKSSARGFILCSEMTSK
ncbi:hypothetical protein ABVT39_015373 [Epinephelus coioides]